MPTPTPDPSSSLTPALRAAAGPVPTMAAAWLAAFVLAFFHARADALLIALGFAGAVAAGLVGVGGAIITIPLLLYVPPLVGQSQLDIHTVSGITMVQVAAAGLAGMLGHVQHRPIRGRLVTTLGGGMVIGSLLGAAFSRAVAPAALTAVFAALALVAAIVMILARRTTSPDQEQRADIGAFHGAVAIGSGLLVGLLAGMVGAGGGFLLIPLMIYVLHVPLRSAIGASLGIVVLSGVAGMLGKAATGQVDWLMALALVTGALPGARLGAWLSRRLRIETLNYILGGLLAIVALKMWWEILT